MDFEICRRKRYWSKYAAWGGWKSGAPPPTRQAYLLNKLDSRHTLMGRATENGVRWALDEQQAGRAPTAEAAYEAAARPLLNRAWQDSKSGAWQQNPKNRIGLHEHYYPQLHPNLPGDWPAKLRAYVMRCVDNFIQTVLPRLRTVTPDQEVVLAAPESFSWEGLTIYAVPDYVYQQDGIWHIHDWKAGKPSAHHLKQLAVYALWAHTKHQVSPEAIRLYVEYLHEGRVAVETGSAALLDQARSFIQASAMDMADYLKEGDPQRNQPRPREEWDMTPERTVCRRCNFYELCAPEFTDSD